MKFRRIAPGPPEFLASLGMLACFMVIVVVALAWDGNRPKALRVGLAAATYLLVLAAAGIAAGRAAARKTEAAALPPARGFLIAGGAAGLVSGIARPEVSAPVVAVQTLGAALLLGGFHWCAARMWRRVRAWITGGLGVTLLLAIPASCGPVPARDPWPAAAWPATTPEAQGLDPAVLSRLDGELRAGRHGLVDGLLVIRNGLAVHQASFTRDYDTPFRKITQPPGPYNYFDPEWHPYYRRGRLHTLQSVSKSVTSALIGIAIMRGEIPGVGVKVLPYFDGIPIRNLDDRKSAITLEDLLTMRSGLEWDEWSADYTSAANSCAVMEGLDDWVGYVLDRPMAHAPGAVFTYNSGVTMLLAHILKAATGRDAEEYAREHLFDPLGIREHHWKRTPRGIPDAEGGLYLTAADLARIGYLYLRGGVWDGRRILPDEWVARSVTPIVAAASTGIEGFGYGYQWWAGPQAFAAFGYGGQRLFVVPGHDLIAVFTGWNIYDRAGLEPIAALDRVLEAVRTPLRK